MRLKWVWIECASYAYVVSFLSIVRYLSLRDCLSVTFHFDVLLLNIVLPCVCFRLCRSASPHAARLSRRLPLLHFTSSISVPRISFRAIHILSNVLLLLLYLPLHSVLRARFLWSLFRPRYIPYLCFSHLSSPSPNIYVGPLSLIDMLYPFAGKATIYLSHILVPFPSLCGPFFRFSVRPSLFSCCRRSSACSLPSSP